MAVTNIKRLLNFDLKRGKKRDVNGHSTRVQSHWCITCLHGFQRLEAYEKHIGLCKKNTERTTLYTMPTDQYIDFEDWSKTIKHPFAIYADLEAVLEKVDEKTVKHKPVAAGLVLVYLGEVIQYHEFTGYDCVEHFLRKVEQISRKIIYPWYEAHSNEPMLPLSSMEESEYRRQTVCYLCKKRPVEVRDHDHFTGRYIAGACNKCNLARRIRKFVPIVFHNLRGYDVHHILKYALAKFSTWNLSVIPQTEEKYISLTCHVDKMTFRFLDSLMFLTSSLDSLVKTLESTPLTSKVFDSEIVKGKGIFPYEMATSMEAMLAITRMPDRWETINEEQHQYAVAMWERYECRNLFDYMRTYLKLDCYLLADVFETFRIQSMEEDGLEPLSFFTMPGMSWASALKSKEHEIELIRDPEIYKFFDGGIRGGMTFINKHYVKADENTELLYADVNNLYGWALTQNLPHGEFEMIDDPERMAGIMEKCYTDDFDGDTGYSMEVDLTIPQEIHDKLDDLPAAPTTMCPPGSRVKKLLLTHYDKDNYVVHCRLLALWLKLGVKVKKVNRIVKYKQAKSLRNILITTQERELRQGMPLKEIFTNIRTTVCMGRQLKI